MGKFKIMFFAMNKSGHMNPIWPVLKELIQTGDFEIIIFVDDDNRKKVESIGAKFMPVINNFKPFDILTENSTAPSPLYYFLKAFFEITRDNFKYMASEIDKEKPDLILYDFLCKHLIWAVRYYENCYSLGQKMSQLEVSKMKFCPKRPLPPIACFSPSFGMHEGIYPNNFELTLQKRIPSIWDKIKIYFLQLKFCYRYGFKLSHMKNIRPFNQPEFVEKIFFCIVPEVQPRAHLFNQKRYRFLGSTVNANFVDPLVNDEKFKNLLGNVNSGFIKRNNLEIPNDDEFKLIYASCGTVFNKSVDLYKCIIDAFKTFDQEPVETRHPQLRLKHLKIIVSLGDVVYNEIESQLRAGEYKLPENIIVVKKAPQIDILKKASLFITHGGMNSASESIHFGGNLILLNFLILKYSV